MDTLSEALGRSAEQSQTLENLHNRKYKKLEEKSSVPVRQHFILDKSDPFYDTSPFLL